MTGPRTEAGKRLLAQTISEYPAGTPRQHWLEISPEEVLEAILAIEAEAGDKAGLPDGEVITDANGDELERGAGDKAEAPATRPENRRGDADYLFPPKGRGSR